MNRLRYLAGLGVLALALGCTNTRFNFIKGPEQKAPPPSGYPTAPALVGYLNDNASRLQTIRSVDLDLTCSVGMQSFGLRGKMISQSPRNFLMSADTLGNRVVDLGSNDKEFWYWMSKGDPFQIYCSYKDLEEGRVKRLPFPFQPQWIVDALGQGNYGPAEKYTVEPDGGNLKLVERTKSPQGAPVRKMIVMRARPVQPPTPQVVAFLLVDEATGREICSAEIKETQIDRATGGVFPRRMELRWPEQKLRLAMRLDGITVNPPIPPEVFVREPMRGVPGFNLATMQADANPVQRVRGARP